MIDLRSDTVTKPSAAMRDAMARAEVGDDVYGEDPSVEALQARVAELLGKEAALFVPSGTMANQLAVMCHCRRGDEVLTAAGTHTLRYEAGAGPALSGVTMTPLPQALCEPDHVTAAISPDDAHYPRTSLLALENTHNRAGGRVFPQARLVAVARRAHEHGLRVHLDGARLWNAAVSSGLSLSELAEPADSVSVCFSKGLGAPVGSALAGSAQLIAQARRYRKMLGGGMRQVGVLAAAACYALDHQLDRLADDHAHARLFAERIAVVEGVCCDRARVESNIVLFELERVRAAELVAEAAAHGVLVGAFGLHTVRAVTHLDVTRDEVLQAADRLAELVKG